MSSRAAQAKAPYRSLHNRAFRGRTLFLGPKKTKRIAWKSPGGLGVRARDRPSPFRLGGLGDGASGRAPDCYTRKVVAGPRNTYTHCTPAQARRDEKAAR